MEAIMTRVLILVLVAAAAGGGWYLCANFTLDVRRTSDGKLEQVRIIPRKGGSLFSRGDPLGSPDGAARPNIKIATFNLGGLDETKLANLVVTDVLVRTIPRFDVVAVQGVRGRNRGVLVRLVEQINATGRSYDYAVSLSAERNAAGEYSAFLFDQSTIEIDRSTVQSVEDPGKRFRHRPLVASFRARGPAEAEAFTFTLINVQTDPAQGAAERDLLASVYRAVRDNGRNEDDIILLGDLEADNEHLGALGRVANITAALSNTPTTARSARLDNILFDRLATTEFTGRAGVMDLMREFVDLPSQSILEVSEHLPVWAEFSSYEGGQAGQP
jgi:deoxyribonuclease-1-like protein